MAQVNMLHQNGEWTQFCQMAVLAGTSRHQYQLTCQMEGQGNHVGQRRMTYGMRQVNKIAAAELLCTAGLADVGVSFLAILNALRLLKK